MFRVISSTLFYVESTCPFPLPLPSRVRPVSLSYSGGEALALFVWCDLVEVDSRVGLTRRILARMCPVGSIPRSMPKAPTRARAAEPTAIECSNSTASLHPPFRSSLSLFLSLSLNVEYEPTRKPSTRTMAKNNNPLAILSFYGVEISFSSHRSSPHVPYSLCLDYSTNPHGRYSSRRAATTQ